MEVPAEHGWIVGGDPLRVALSLLLTDEARSDHIVKYIERAGTDGAYDETWGALGALLRPYLNDRVQDGLYRVVVRSVEQGPYLNRLGAGALAEWGDERLLAILKALQAQREPGFAAKQVCQIQVQSPPEMLLAVIGGDDQEHASRAWALRRAVEHGLPRGAIVGALRAYCEKNEETKFWRVQAADLKTTAVRLNIIQPTDLPNIPYYDPYSATKAGRAKISAAIEWISEGSDLGALP